MGSITVPTFTKSGTTAVASNANTGGMNGFAMIDNYIYIYHTGVLVSLPTYPASINDNMSAQFTPTTPLSRSAPIQSYISSGPRQFEVQLSLHRDMMGEIAYRTTKMNNAIVKGDNSATELNDNYVDTIIKELQSCVIPRYDTAEKMVDPPLVAVRFGNEIYCKGIINGTLGVTYSGPILGTDKYAKVDISFQITEVDPYDADIIRRAGSFRGLNTSLERNVWSVSTGTANSVSARRL